MNFGVGEWEFNKEVSNCFDDHVVKSVPSYEKFHEMIFNMSEWFVEDNTNVYDIGTSTGKALLNLERKHSNKHIKFIGIDKSEDMLGKIERVSENVVVEKKDVAEGYVFKNASFITSVLTMQFISIKHRSKVLESVYNGLNEGGAFVLVEKVITKNPLIGEMFTQMHYDFKQKNGFTEKEILDKSKSIRGVMKPLTLDKNIELLKSAGFENIEVFLQDKQFVGLICVK